MQNYVGTKLIQAKPFTRGEYNTYRGFPPINANTSDEGYLVEYLDGGAPNDDRHQGYISWSPKDVFEKSYRPITGFPFGHAVELMKFGFLVKRNKVPGDDVDVWYGIKPTLPDLILNGEIIEKEEPIFLYWQDGSYAGELHTADLFSPEDILAEDWTFAAGPEAPIAS